MKKHFQFINHGTIMQIACLTEQAKEWLEKHCQAEVWQWMGTSLYIEPRMFDSIYVLIKEEFESDS